MSRRCPRSRVGVANFRDQLSRSETAVAATYAEACAPESRRDFASKMAKALKEAKEKANRQKVLEDALRVRSL